MPSQKVNFPQIVKASDGLGENRSEYATPIVEIAWTPEAVGGDVQLVATVDRRFVLQRASETDESMQTIGFATAPLTRPEINGLIRVLRRARNAAYGSDE